MQQLQKMKTALIGSGMISGIYLKNMKEQFDILELVGCSDIRPERSKARAEEFGVRCMTNEEIFADPSIEMVVNTTYPTAHFEVSKAALEAGKNVYCEKMTTLSVEQSTELMELAASSMRGRKVCRASWRVMPATLTPSMVIPLKKVPVFRNFCRFSALGRTKKWLRTASPTPSSTTNTTSARVTAAMVRERRERLGALRWVWVAWEACRTG